MRHFLLWAMAVVMLTACAEDGLNEVSGTKPTDEAPETLIASFEDDDTRIQLNDELRTVWTEGDLVSVFYRSDANQKWQYTGQTGARVGELTRVDAGTATTPTTRVVVVYPYNANYYFNTETYNVQASLPAVQTYLSGSYGLDGNILVSSGEYNQISLKSVCGWLKLQLTGEGEKVRSITLRGNNGEQVAGELYINTSDATAQLASAMGGSDDGDVGGAGGGLIFEDTILKEVTLNCGTGVELGAEATAFYIALPPMTFDGGITAEISTTDGATMTKSTDNSIVIERNHIQPMTTFDYNGVFKPANNEIYYTNGSTTAPTAPNNKTAFGDATIQSNTYDAEKKCWIITFDKDITEIGDLAFFVCTKLTSVTIPDSVTTIRDQAFYACHSLTSVTIPDSVTTIGYAAFSSCSSLKEFKGKFAADNGRCLIKDNTIIAYAEASGTTYTIPDSVTTIGESAFYYCYSLTSVTIPDSVTTIGDQAFSGCECLTSVTIPNSVTTIGVFAFAYCRSLTSVTIPDSVTTIGESAFRDCSSLTSVTIPDSVTTIGEGAFASCDSLKEFKGKFAADNGRCLIMDNTIIAYANASDTTYTIPDSVTTIGDRAFYFCESLTSVTIPDGVTTIGDSAFNGCTKLTSVTIGNSVTTIGQYAFDWCTSLTSVIIPDSVTTIGERAFSVCESLTSVYCKRTTPPAGGSDMFDNNAAGRRIFVPASDDDSIINAYKEASGWSEYKDDIFEEGPANNEIWYTATAKVEPHNKTVFGATYVSNEWDSETGKGVITFSGDVTKIGDHAFYGYQTDCNKLTSVTIPDSVTTIGDSAFYWCYNLTSVTIPDSVTTIGESVFYSCTILTSVTIPEGVTTIGDEAFLGCDSLTSVTIPDSVTTIGEYAFYWSDNLTSVTIGNSVTTIGDYAFSLCSSLKEFKGKFASDGGRCLIVDGVLNAFALGCGVTQYTIPDSVTTIGDDAFYNCTSLTSVTIPDSVTTIGNYAFRDCESLTSVTIPDSVTTIGDYAFDCCYSLATVYCKRTTPPAGGGSMFDYNASGRKIYVPASDDDSIIKAYKAKLWWSDYADCIFEEEPKPANNEIWYTATAKVEPYFTDEFGATYLSNVWDSETGKGVITFSGDVTKIGGGAFYGYQTDCNKLTSVNIPNSVTTIGGGAFSHCTSLTSVTIPDSVTTIGNSAFKFCDSLKSVTIPDSVTTIGHYAFEYCDSLKTVYCKPTTPPTGGYSMFDDNASGRKIYVPASDDDSIINAYKAKKYWSNYADYIFEDASL